MGVEEIMLGVGLAYYLLLTYSKVNTQSECFTSHSHSLLTQVQRTLELLEGLTK